MTEPSPGRRLLFLLPFAPRLDAVHGGSRTIAQLVAALANRHRVALVYLRGPEEPPVDNVFLACCEVVEEVARNLDPTMAGRLLQGARVARSRLGGRPRWVAQWSVRAYEQRIQTVARSWCPDIVQIEYHIMGQYVGALSDCAAPRVLVQHEPGAKAAHDRQRLQQGLPKLLSLVEVRAWERYEKTIMRQVQTIVVFTDRDRQVLAPVVEGVPIVRIPIGTVLPERPLDPMGSSPTSICFVGNFIHPPNVDAAVRLIDTIFPWLRAQVGPELELYIVGDGAPASVRERSGKNVFVTGRVPDVGPYLDRASVVAVPLRLGGGMRVKVIEALAAGKAVVASPLAVEGLELTDGDQVVIAETDQEFCTAIVGLLGDPEQRVALGLRARAWACANLGWDKSVAAYERLYDSLIGGS